MKVVVSERAATDLTAIADFVARDNPGAAARLMDRLLGRLRSLAAFPELGRPVAEWPAPHIRELIEGNYRIVYQIGASDVEVLTVFEGHRRFVAPGS